MVEEYEPDEEERESHALIDGIITITFCGERWKWLMLDGAIGIPAVTPPRTEGEKGTWHDFDPDDITCDECRAAVEEALSART